MNLDNVVNIFIDLNVIINSTNDEVTSEIGPLITLGRKVYVWDPIKTIPEIREYCTTRGIQDYVYDYMMKDSANFGKVDFIVSDDLRSVERFKRIGVNGNYVKSLGESNV